MDVLRRDVHVMYASDNVQMGCNADVQGLFIAVKSRFCIRKCCPYRRQVTHVLLRTKSFAPLMKREEQEMSYLLRVGVIGDFNPHLRYHLATNEALRHA